jgi:hypothetical protein
MRTKQGLAACLASLVFSVVAVWFVLLNGRFTSEGAPLSGYEPLIFICICAAAALIFAAVGGKAFKGRISLVAVAILVGIVAPGVVIVAPAVFCLVFQCQGFDWL